MKKQRFYLIIATIVRWILSRLRFCSKWQAWIGNLLLQRLNILGAKWIYEGIRKNA